MARNQRDENLVVSGPGLSIIDDINTTANGTENVTISNVAPAGVGTATITKWLTVRSSNGTLFYIPMWT